MDPLLHRSSCSACCLHTSRKQFLSIIFNRKHLKKTNVLFTFCIDWLGFTCILYLSDCRNTCLTTKRNEHASSMQKILSWKYLNDGGAHMSKKTNSSYHHWWQVSHPRPTWQRRCRGGPTKGWSTPRVGRAWQMGPWAHHSQDGLQKLTKGNLIDYHIYGGPEPTYPPIKKKKRIALANSMPPSSSLSWTSKGHQPPVARA